MLSADRPLQAEFTSNQPTMKSSTLTPGFHAALLGLIFSLLTIMYGQGMGIFFGVNEDAIKHQLKSSAMEVRETVYQGNDAAMKTVLDSSWNYMKRAHLHAGGMGTTAFALMVAVALLGIPRGRALVLGLALGLGGLGYSLYWMWAGFRAPGLGSTAAAKESLKWLAMPASGMFVLATLTVLVLLVGALASRPGSSPVQDTAATR
jgi:hypothetical protein